MDRRLAESWHDLSFTDVVTVLESDINKGLTASDVVERQEQYGANRITPQKSKGPLLMFLLQFHQPLIYILLAASLITLLLKEWVDSGVIFGVVLVNAIIGFIQESKALKAIEALARSMEGSATVLRDGKKSTIAASDLVPGDLVLLQSGDKVPADLRLINSRELQIDESALTGESVPVQKREQQLEAQTLLAERSNMMYSSTLVTYGTGTGVVVAIGDNTEIGRINTLIASAASLATPLTRKITHFSKVLLWVILGLSVLTFIAGWLHGESLLDTFMAAVALAVGAIPEGLPAAMTIMLAIGVSKMATRHAIIRKMPAVETLGSTTVVCSDKTGTLTKNQMTVMQVFSGDKNYQFTGTGYAPEGDVRLNDSVIQIESHPLLKECLTAGLLCNDSRLIANDGQWSIEGDPTEVALITAANKVGILEETLTSELPRVDVLPFESQHQYMATLHDLSSGQEKVMYLKGSVEKVLACCQDRYDENLQLVPLDKDRVYREMESMANKGLRVLAFAKKVMPADSQTVKHQDIDQNLSFIGLQAMMDPPRDEAMNAVRVCQSAGIQVKMITGDHVSTAAAIARNIGIGNNSEKEAKDFAIGGNELPQLSDSELVKVVQRSAVFARVTPEQKLRLVEALQKNDHVVAMTGDGVNDAPALKQADIGVAMGEGGTEVAKEAADMILIDDNFATIEAAIEEGRTVFDNLVKFITWTLPTNIGEGLVILIAIFLGLTLPITPVQILWINMTTALLLGMMLAFEGKEPGIMSRPPRDPKASVLTRELLIRIGIVSFLLLAGAYGLFEWAVAHNKDLETARTFAVNMFVFGEMFYLFHCRSLRYSMFKLGVFSNHWLLFGVACMTLLQVFFTHAAVMNKLFGTSPLEMFDWMLVIACALIIYICVGIEKWFRRLYERKVQA